MEGSHSGLVHALGKRAYRKVSGVRISPLPPKNMKTILVDAVYAFVSEQGVIFQDLHELLEQYPNPKIILTGAPDDKWEQYGLNKVPYPVFSLKQNPPKSSPEYYKQMLEHFKLKSTDVVYFEHNTDAVKSAQSVGINTYHYDENTKDLAALKKFFDSNLS